MYRIVSMDGKEIGITDKINFIRRGSSGSFITADNLTATGIAYHGKAYDLAGHEEIGGADTVTVAEIDGSAYVKAARQSAADIDYFAMMSEIELPRKVVENKRPHMDELEAQEEGEE